MSKVDKAIDVLLSEEGEPLFSNPYVFDDKWLDEHVEGSWTRREDGRINVRGDISFRNMGLEKLPYSFHKVTGRFDCSSNQLTSLEGCPEVARDNFDCSYNQLTSLSGGPKEVGGNFFCSYNQLTSLEGCPKEVKYSFDCTHNQLTTLRGCPEYVGNMWCRYNLLTNFVGGPEKVNSSLYAIKNPFESLEGAPKYVGRRFRTDQFTEMQYREYARDTYGTKD